MHSKAFIHSLHGFVTEIQGKYLEFSVNNGYLVVDDVGEAVACFVPNSWRDIVIHHAEGED